MVGRRQLLWQEIVKTYERDIEEVSKADKYRTPIFTNDATAKKYFSFVENGLIEL